MCSRLLFFGPQPRFYRNRDLTHESSEPSSSLIHPELFSFGLMKILTT